MAVISGKLGLNTLEPDVNGSLPAKLVDSDGNAIDNSNPIRVSGELDLPENAAIEDGGHLDSIDDKLRTTANGLKTDGSGVTQPISAAALPLPAGAATSAKQPALGTAGTPATDVLTVQGRTGMTPLDVALAATPLPANAAIESGGHLASIDAKLTNP